MPVATLATCGRIAQPLAAPVPLCPLMVRVAGAEPTPTVAVVPTTRAFCALMPPAVIMEPVVLDEASVVSVDEIAPLDVIAPVDVLPETVRFVDMVFVPV